MAALGSDDLQQLSGQLQTLTTVVLVLLTIPVLMQPVGAMVVGWRDGDGPSLLAQEFGRVMLRITPSIWYLCALWAVRRIFKELARDGQAFQPTLARGLRGVGWSLAWGAGMDVVGTPLLLRYTDGEPGGVVANYIPAAIALGVVGLALVLLSRLIGRAAELRSELDQII